MTVTVVVDMAMVWCGGGGCGGGGDGGGGGGGGGDGGVRVGRIAFPAQNLSTSVHGFLFIEFSF